MALWQTWKKRVKQVPGMALPWKLCARGVQGLLDGSAFVQRTIYGEIQRRRHRRTIQLCLETLPTKRYRQMQGPGCHGVIEDLAAYTGLPAEDLRARLLREPRFHFKSEFAWHDPRSNIELAWFYRCCGGYLFANAPHVFWPKLDFLQPTIGRVLDYGGGVGCNTLGLARRGFDVDYFEIGVIQADFTRFRASKHGLSNIRFLTPFAGGRFDPVHSITDQYAAIVAQDVLEHVPNYHILVRHLIDHLQPGGYILESSPFEENAPDIGIHLRASMPMEQAMVGMKRIQEGVWQKVAMSQAA